MIAAQPRAERMDGSMTWQKLFGRLLKALGKGKPHKGNETAEMDTIRVHLGQMPDMVRSMIKHLSDTEPKKP